ncbi:MAG: ATP-dependent metallopeptidase FtsH/Yme1/Tma family protein [Calditrichaeota bacterium]|nr:ATP-dependent zinc metalloprotease FtsH [Calditrichota bacterium]RQW05316.1 MAG: ATP-dependent metallopeptidase FtsH/Yme1/Tma family protein [Calditrichota bacterium]
MGIIMFASIFPSSGGQEPSVPYSKYVYFLENDLIARGEVVVKENEFRGTLKQSFQDVLPNGKTIEYKKFTTVLPFVDENMVKEWQAKGVSIEFVQPSSEWLLVLGQMLPWILLIGFWIFLARRMQGAGGGGGKNIFSFGKSRAKMMMESETKVTFDDVAGCDEAKEELREIIEFLKNPAKFNRLGGKIPKGALLLGPPGTGKTLLARAVAGEAGVPFFSMSGADFVEMFVGVGASRVRDLFETGRKQAPCIIFIDEMDAVGRQRGAGLGGGHDEREQTLNALLVEMDGFDTKEGVIILAATNRPDVLDAALLRPGRFDRQIVVDRPDVRGREGILKVHTKNIPLAQDVDLAVLAKGTPGLAGAELANLVNEAALSAARQDRDYVTMEDFEMSKDKIMMGMERKSLIISDEEKRMTAYHESGHVLVAKLIPGSDPVHKVTIIPRGRALGLTSYLPIDERHNYTKEYLEILLCHLLGGRGAEKLVMNQLTTGAGNDIERATDLARKMVCEWGMSEELGPITFGKKEEEIFLGREIAQHRDFSESTAQAIDREVRQIISRAEQKVEKLLSENLEKLHKLAEALLEREILDGEEIDLILDGKKLPKKPAAVKVKKKVIDPEKETVVIEEAKARKPGSGNDKSNEAAQKKSRQQKKASPEKKEVAEKSGK